MGKSEKTQVMPRRSPGGMQTIIWLLLALGMCALPLVAGSQHMRAGPASRANHWMKNYHLAMQAYNAGQYAAAYTRFRELADFGSAGAQTMIGHLYWTGKGVEQAPGKAFLWFHRAAQRGYAPAQLATGRAYALGRGIEQSNVDAALWLSLVEARGASEMRAEARKELAKVTKSFTADDISKLNDLKQHWRPDVALMP
jgi:uncharacterized protein